MSLVDDVTIIVLAGNGGKGSHATLSTPGSNKLRPDGGTGGDGGNIYFEASNNITDLSEFRFKKEIKAENGVDGKKKNLTGKKGEDAIILVPPGTRIIDEHGDEVEIIEIGTPVLLARGGKGELGNHDVNLPEFQDKATTEEERLGERKALHLILRLIADVGFIGLPNAGKSSLLSSLTNSRPKIGNYPFTTIEPNLGALGTIMLADIPGLIEGASEGRGLGIQFLKHIEKTKALLHCIDATESDLIKTYQTVKNEFKEYSDELLQKEEIILLTKIDLIDSKELEEKRKVLEQLNKRVIPVSIYDEKSLEHVKQVIEEHVAKE